MGTGQGWVVVSQEGRSSLPHPYPVLVPPPTGVDGDKLCVVTEGTDRPVSGPRTDRRRRCEGPTVRGGVGYRQRVGTRKHVAPWNRRGNRPKTHRKFASVFPPVGRRRRVGRDLRTGRTRSGLYLEEKGKESHLSLAQV